MHDGLIFIGWPQLYFKANATARRQSTLTRSTQPEEPGVSLVIGERQISPSVKKTSNSVVVRCSLKELFIESYAQYDIFVYVLLFVCQGISALSALSKIQSCDCKITSSGIHRSIRSYWDPGTQKFKSVTRIPAQSLKVGHPSTTFKSWVPGTLPFFNEFIFFFFFFSEYFIFFFVFDFSLFLNSKYTFSAYLAVQVFLDEFICKLRGMSYTRTSFNVRKDFIFLSFLISYSLLTILKLVATVFSQILRQILLNQRFKQYVFKRKMIKCT